MALKNETCVKYSMSPQAYKFVNTHAHEKSSWKNLSRSIHVRNPHLGGINGDIHSDLSTLSFKNGEQIESFQSIMLRLQH